MSKKTTITSDERSRNIGAKIKELRIKAGYTSYEVFAHEHGIDRKQYWRIENGTNITLHTLFRVLDAHEKSLKDFFARGIEDL